MGRKRRAKPFQCSAMQGILVAHGVRAFEKTVFGPCTLVRTWGTRLA
jgi:hypothetical protein